MHPGRCQYPGKESEAMVVGKSVTRVDARDKVTGSAKFTDDLIMPGCLVAKVYHAEIAHGRVVSIDTSQAPKAMPFFFTCLDTSEVSTEESVRL